jgi:serine/threonine protein kinase
MGWSYPCDMWSLGCIIVELLTGNHYSTGGDLLPWHLPGVQGNAPGKLLLSNVDISRLRSWVTGAGCLWLLLKLKRPPFPVWHLSKMGEVNGAWCSLQAAGSCG